MKLSAFLDRYSKGLRPEPAAALRALWKAWNEGGEVPDAEDHFAAAWGGFLGQREALASHARAWSRSLQVQPELAGALAKFAANLLK